MKKITTGTKIIFKETGEKYSLKQTETGFDITPVKLSKKLESESYNFEEFLEHFNNNEITIEGFDEHDNTTVEPQIINYMHEYKITDYRLQITNLENKIQELICENNSLKEKNSVLEEKNKSLEEVIISEKEA